MYRIITAYFAAIIDDIRRKGQCILRAECGEYGAKYNAALRDSPLETMRKASTIDFTGASAGILGIPGKISRAEKLGDLTAREISQIQGIVNKARRPVNVVGSAAKGARRNVGKDLPVGKGPGTKSDIDYVAPASSFDYFRGLNSKLPSIDPATGIIPGAHNPFMGPAIRFEPGVMPTYVPQQ